MRVGTFSCSCGFCHVPRWFYPIGWDGNEAKRRTAATSDMDAFRSNRASIIPDSCVVLTIETEILFKGSPCLPLTDVFLHVFEPGGMPTTKAAITAR